MTDICDKDTGPILCPKCYRPTRYALNTHRYVCDVHGPVINGEMLPVGVRP